MEQLSNLLDVWEKLETRERKVLLAFMYRLYAGQRKFGALKVGKYDWSYEAIEEALDASVYLTCMLSDKVDKAIDHMVSDAEEELQVKADLDELEDETYVGYR